MTTNKTAIEFPIQFDEALKEISLSYKMKLKEDTHFEAVNRELQWFRKNSEFRLDFTVLKDSIVATYYVTTYPIFAKLLILFDRIIPLFPKYAKINWYKLPSVPLEMTQAEFKKMIVTYIDKILSGDTSIFVGK